MTFDVTRRTLHETPPQPSLSVIDRRSWIAHCVAAIPGALAASATRPVAAQPWAKRMFKTLEHDFGTVARGAKAEFVFEFENVYEETLRLAGVRSSCGCTSVALTKDTLHTFEKGGVIATFNTASFLGHRSATLTVTFDKPFTAEVQLNVQGFIRSDVVFTPGSVDFGVVDVGHGASKQIAINYAGKPDWRILDVRSANSHLEVELNERGRGNGRVSYDMVVFLKPDLPEGFFQDQLLLVTNDTRNASVPLVVEGRVAPALSLSPASLYLGSLAAGETTKKQLVVRGRQPFRIRDIRSEDPRFEFEVGNQAKTLHLIPLRFTAGNDSEKISAVIEVETDVPGSGKLRCAASGTINVNAANVEVAEGTDSGDQGQTATPKR